MAQKVQVLLVDDLDGSQADETVTFGLDGVSYEIDLSSGNASKLRGELTQYVEHARKSSAAQARRAKPRCLREFVIAGTGFRGQRVEAFRTLAVKPAPSAVLVARRAARRG